MLTQPLYTARYFLFEREPDLDFFGGSISSSLPRWRLATARWGTWHLAEVELTERGAGATDEGSDGASTCGQLG